MISEWLDGVQPIDNDRNILPAFFEKLAYLNKQNIVKEPYTSILKYQKKDDDEEIGRRIKMIIEKNKYI